ncbi:MAG: hypothetical protein Q9171_004682 [Xanthocarpia ochracea]
MDPISLTASFITIIGLTTEATSYLKELKHGSEDRVRLREEVRSIQCLLEILKDRVEDSDVLKSDLSSIQSLKLPGGPLDQLTNALQQLKKKLAPGDGLVHKPRPLLWPLQKKEVKDLIDTIERQKSAFTLAIQNDHIEISLNMRSRVASIDDNVTLIKVRQEYDHLKDDHRMILDWLVPANFWTRQQDVTRTRTRDTGTWLLEDSVYRLWLQAGAGKTVLASLVIESLCDTVHHTRGAVAFIYCNYKERTQQTLDYLVSSLIRQLVESHHELLEDLSLLYNRHSGKGTRPSGQELLGTLGSFAKNIDPLFLVVDALDECDTIGGIRSALPSELQKLLPKARFFFTSRYLTEIEHLFNGCARLEIRASDQDIRRYISSQVACESRLAKHIEKDHSLLKDVEEAIIQKSAGMFLLARLHLGALATKHTRKALRSALQSLPIEVDRTYEETLRRINDQNHDDVSLAKQVLVWVFHARNPLTLKELQHAIAAIHLDGETDIDDEDLPDGDILVSVCAGIITVDQESGQVRLVHYTAQDYLERNPVIHPASAQAQMTETCITYLSLDNIGQKPCVDFEDLLARCELYPFVQYAAENWGNHARGDAEETCRESILKFLSKADLRGSAHTISISVKYIYLQFEQIEDGSEISALASAAGFGLTNVVRYLLKQGHDVDTADRFGVTALHRAAEKGHVDVMRTLMLAGANIHKSDQRGHNPLCSVASSGFDEAVELLLDAGASIKQKSRYWGSVLKAATRGGHISTVGLLLDRGADIHVERGILKGAVMSAAAPMIKFISKKMDAARKRHDIDAALLFYLKNGYLSGPSTVECMEALINEGANPHATTANADAPIHLAAKRQSADAVKVLLSCGVDPDLGTNSGDTALHRAAFLGSIETAEALLDHGANIAARNNSRGTVFHACLRGTAHYGMVSFLLRYGVPIHGADLLGRTPLHEAARRGYGSIVKLLVDEGADLTLKNHKGWTPLEDAAASEQASVVEVLLEHHGMVRSPNVNILLKSAHLRRAVSKQDDSEAERLLGDPQIYINTSDHEGRTALHDAAKHGQIEIAKALLERGASVNAKIVRSGLIGRAWSEMACVTPLHYAARNGHVEIVNILLNHGAKLNVTGHSLGTPFLPAVQHGHLSVVKLLLKHNRKASGSDKVDARGHLQVAAFGGHKDVVRLLLENGDDEARDTEIGRMALVTAIRREDYSIADLLREYGFKLSQREWNGDQRGSDRQR